MHSFNKITYFVYYLGQIQSHWVIRDWDSYFSRIVFRFSCRLIVLAATFSFIISFHPQNKGDSIREDSCRIIIATRLEYYIFLQEQNSLFRNQRRGYYFFSDNLSGNFSSHVILFMFSFISIFLSYIKLKNQANKYIFWSKIISL